VGLFHIFVSRLYCTPSESHPNSLTIWGHICQPHLLVPPKQVQLTKFSFRGQEVESRIFKFCIPSPPRNNKYYTPLLPRCATKVPPSIFKKHHSAQQDLWWRSDLAVTGEGGGVSQRDGVWHISVFYLHLLCYPSWVVERGYDTSTGSRCPLNPWALESWSFTSENLISFSF
jgi:hypothetical protein